jgi:hypothetical protein
LKIAFIVSSLEPGRDGVGDYTRRLAGELIRQGHGVRILALNDKATKPEKSVSTSDLRPLTSDFAELQESEGTSIECLRLPGTMPWSERTKLARGWLDTFNPDWASLQYVSFGFHPKGLPYKAHKHLIDLTRSITQRHLFFHEIWVGASGSPPIKLCILRYLQKRLILSFIQRFQANVLQTSIPFYARCLSGMGASANVLPLIGSIPPTTSDCVWFQNILKNHHLNPSTDWILGTFGAVSSNWDPSLLLNDLVCEAKKSSRQVGFFFIGNVGNSISSRIDYFRSNCPEVIFDSLGEQSPSRISAFISGLNWSISKHEWGYHGRSSTDAAMFEHGTPVISILTTALEEISHPLLIKYCGVTLDLLQSERKPSVSPLHKVAHHFLRCLQDTKFLNHMTKTSTEISNR